MVFLFNEVKDLNRRIGDLEKEKSLRDFHIEDLERNNQRLCQELKRQGRSNRHLKRKNIYIFFLLFYFFNIKNN